MGKDALVAQIRAYNDRNVSGALAVISWRIANKNKKLDLSQTNLSHADLRGADLSSSDLSGTDMSNSMLEDADLKYAEVGGANLEDAKLLHAINLGFSTGNPANINQANTEFLYDSRKAIKTAIGNGCQ
ncbi:hypothetical protein HON52_01445 [Candidatus Uhrbacteria bacterium]|nr:hypothetical protein [Candidatus Uhrbacteria bacterium]